MFPFIEVGCWIVSTNTVLMVLMIAITLAVLVVAFRRDGILLYKYVLLVGIMTVIGLRGNQTVLCPICRRHTAPQSVSGYTVPFSGHGLL